uniref:Uncharacterized protein n=1 Tax=Noctiluca scintillans TaxID=2966 RepID=A0A7S1ANF0_NOCSC
MPEPSDIAVADESPICGRHVFRLRKRSTIVPTKKYRCQFTKETRRIQRTTEQSRDCTCQKPSACEQFGLRTGVRYLEISTFPSLRTRRTFCKLCVPVSEFLMPSSTIFSNPGMHLSKVPQRLAQSTGTGLFSMGGDGYFAAGSDGFRSSRRNL